MASPEKLPRVYREETLVERRREKEMERERKHGS